MGEYLPIDIYSRKQPALKFEHMYPKRDDGICSHPDCERLLTGRRKRWCSNKCRDEAVTLFLIIKGDSKIIRRELYKRQKGCCQECWETTEDWEADHILPVVLGGGATDINNFQTLCKECHKKKTAELNRELSRMRERDNSTQQIFRA